MRALTSHIRNSRDGITNDLMLHIEVPLLHVRPDRLGGNGHHSQWELRVGGSARARVARNIDLLYGGGQRRRVFQRFRVAFVAVGVLVEDTVAATNRPLPVAKGIPGKPSPWRGVEQMPFHAAIRYSGRDPALHDTVGQIRYRRS